MLSAPYGPENTVTISTWFACSWCYTQTLRQECFNTTCLWPGPFHGLATVEGFGIRMWLFINAVL